MKSARRAGKWASIGALVLVASTGCSRAERAAAPPRALDAGAPLDVPTMAYLSLARALHHEANLREDEGDLRGAIARVERIVRADVPHPSAPAPEVEEILADAWARLAELEVRAGDPAKAEEAARSGLAHAKGVTYFRGHLLEVQGIAAESRSNALADAGDPSGAANARATAMQLLEEAVGVQDEVIARVLDAGASGGPSQ